MAAALERHELVAALDSAWQEATDARGAFALEEVTFLGRKVRRYRDAPRSLRELWLATAEHGEHPYLIAGNERITYREAHRQAASFAGWLAERGVGRGDRVAIAMRNHPEWLIAYWACVGMGVSVVGMNAWWTADELEFAIEDSEPKVVLCDEQRLERVLRIGGIADRLVLIETRGRNEKGVSQWSDIVADVRRWPDVVVEGEDEACVLYTSGTTGRPKGARLTHAGCVNVVRGIQFALEVQAAATEVVTGDAVDLGAAPAPVGLVTTPFFHVTANNCFAHPITVGGGTLVLMHKWDPVEALRLVRAERVTTLGGVPTMSREFLMQPGADAENLCTLGTMMSGGAPLPSDLVQKIGAHEGAVMPTTGFGMTELTGAATANSGQFLLAMPDAVGRALPTFDVKVVDDDGALVSRGGTGELCFSGIGVFAGYLGDPTATAETVRDGWLHTGDIAWIDEAGYVHVVDRKKNMIIRGGENVYAAEVEGVVSAHPDVLEACVFAVPDERLGEEVGAAIRLRVNCATDSHLLRAAMGEQLASYKVPRYIWLTEEPLPRNASGKLVATPLKTDLNIAEAT